MSKTIRRIEITAFRHKRLASTGAGPEQPSQPSTTGVDENLVAEIRALVKQLTRETFSAAMVRVSQEPIKKGDEPDPFSRTEEE